MTSRLFFVLRYETTTPKPTKDTGPGVPRWPQVASQCLLVTIRDQQIQLYRDQWVFYSAEKVNFFVNKTDILTVSGKDTIFIFIFLKLFINTMTFEL